MSTTAENEDGIHVFAEVVTEDVDGKEDSEATAAQAETSSQSDSLTEAVGAAVSGDTESEGDGDGIYSRTIVIGVDGSAQSYQAFHWYISNMHMDGNYVVLVHAFELPLLHSFQEMYVSPEMWQATLKREAKNTANMEKRLRGVLSRCKIPGKFVAMGGRPGEMIVKVAEDEKADAVLVGTRGHGKLRRAIMGSVSGYVVHHAPCPVTVCRQKGRHRTESGGSFVSVSSGGRPRYDSGGSTDSKGSRGSRDSRGSRGSRGSQNSKVRFDMSSCEPKEEKRRARHHSTGSAEEKPRKKQETNLFKSILSRRRNKSESSCDTETVKRSEEQNLIPTAAGSSS